MRTILILVAAALLQLMGSFFASRPDMLPDGVFFYVRALAIIGTAVLVARLVSQLLIDVLLPRWLGRAPDEIFRVILLGLCWAVTGGIVLRLAFHQDLGTILTASALFTAIIGLALQATLNNLFSGTALQIERSFNIGDVVRIGTVHGHVEKLSWRAMHLRTIDNSLLIIPNSQLNSTTVEVFRSDRSCRHMMRVPAALVTPPQTMIDLLRELLAGLVEAGRLTRPEAMIDSLNANEGAAWYKIFFHTERFLDGVAVEAEIRARYWYALSRHGLAIPISSVYQAGNLLPDEQAQIAALLARLPRYRDFASEDLATLAGNVRRLRFAAGEVIDWDMNAPPSDVIVHRGAACFPDTASPDALEADAEGKLRHWDAAQLGLVTRRFAAIVGPIAETLVRAAADTTRDPYQLYRLLADHIEEEGLRASFLAQGPTAPSRIVEPRTLIAWGGFSSAVSRRSATPFALGDTELLVIDRAAAE